MFVFGSIDRSDSVFIHIFINDFEEVCGFMFLSNMDDMVISKTRFRFLENSQYLHKLAGNKVGLENFIGNFNIADIFLL